MSAEEAGVLKATQEQVARLICQWTTLHNPDAAWTEDTLEFGLSTYGKNWERFKPAANAIIAAIRPASEGCPKGWKLVPEKITPEMAQRLESNYAECLPPSAVHAANWQAAWTAALAAAPSIPEGE